jgi:hypothetical protein
LVTNGDGKDGILRPMDRYREAVICVDWCDEKGVAVIIGIDALVVMITWATRGSREDENDASKGETWRLGWE